MTMKKMKNFMALLLALVMTMSLVACGNKASEETKTGEEIGCYVQTTETGEKVLVDKDGKAVTDFTLDADGNVLDADGNVVVKAEDITAYVEQSGNVTDEKAEEPKVDDAQKTEDKTDAKDEVKADDKKTARRPRPRLTSPRRMRRSPLTISRIPPRRTQRPTRRRITSLTTRAIPRQRLPLRSPLLPAMTTAA